MGNLRHLSDILIAAPLSSVMSKKELSGCVLFVSILLLVIGLGIIGFSQDSRLLLVGKMQILLASLFLVPSLTGYLFLLPLRAYVRDIKRAALRAGFEVIGFPLLFILFRVWFFENTTWDIWILYLFGFSLVATGGAHLVEYLIQGKILFINQETFSKNLLADVISLENVYYASGVFYLAIPIGLISATFVGVVNNESIQSTTLLAIIIVLGITVIANFILVLNDARRMVNPLFREQPLEIEEPWIPQKGLLNRLRKILSFGRSLETPTLVIEDQKKSDLLIAHLIASLRQLYMYDALHNLMLMAIFVSVLLLMVDFDLPVLIFGAVVLVLSALFVQIPYIIGQKRMHMVIGSHYSGLHRVEIEGALNEYSPLFPQMLFLQALLATGSASSIMFFFLSEIAARQVLGP